MAKCQCGCDGEVSIAKRTNQTLGHIKGQPVRFIPGHHRRGVAPPLEVRFGARVDVQGPNDCWLWTAGRLPAGYGAIWHKGQNRGAHRIAWQLANGAIPEGLWVLHRCDNPPCCNPAHLFLGTQADNDADRTTKGRSSQGIRHPDAKLTPNAVREIRRRVDAGEQQNALADEFGVTAATISYMILGKTWRHVT